MTGKTGHASRRNFLRKLASLGVMGTAAWLRSSDIMAGAASDGFPPLDIEGDVKTRYDTGYESWRQAMMWHLSKPDRKPDMIVQAKSERDVIGVVNYAREHGLKIATRSSGHNSTGSALREGGILLDMSWFRDVQIDPRQASASVQPAVWNVQLIEEAAKHGLAFPAAHCPSVAMGGYLLGGGMGWNHAHWGGPACHSVRRLEVITAEGELLTASPRQNPDLYWAARGAGPGFFGIVTRFELELYPAPASIMTSMYIQSLDKLQSVVATLDELIRVKDERVEILLLLMHNPQAPEHWPPEQSKMCLIGVNAFADSEKEARSMLEPFSKSRLTTDSVFMDEYREASFHKLYNPENVDTGLGRYAVDTDWVDDLEGTLMAVADHFRFTPSPRSHFVVSLATDTRLHDDACFSRIGRHFTGAYVVWNDEKDDDDNYSWLEENSRLIKPYSKGHYVNEITGDRHPQKYPVCFSEENWQRLREVRRKYDPQGVFHNFLGHD